MKNKLFYFLTGAVAVGLLEGGPSRASASEEREALLQHHRNAPPTRAVQSESVPIGVSFFLGEGEIALYRYCISRRRSLNLREVRRQLMRHIGRSVGFQGEASDSFNIPASLCPALYNDYTRYDTTIKGEEALLKEMARTIISHFPPDLTAIASLLVDKSECHRRLAASSTPFAIIRSVIPRSGEDEKKFYARLRAETRHRANIDALYRTLCEGFYEDFRRDANVVRRLREAEALAAAAAQASREQTQRREADDLARSTTAPVRLPAADPSRPPSTLSGQTGSQASSRWGCLLSSPRSCSSGASSSSASSEAGVAAGERGVSYKEVIHIPGESACLDQTIPYIAGGTARLRHRTPHATGQGDRE